MIPTKEGMLHGSYQPESSTKVGKYPSSDPEPNKDIHMDNNEDSDDTDDSDSDYDYPYIVSTK